MQESLQQQAALCSVSIFGVEPSCHACLHKVMHGFLHAALLHYTSDTLAPGIMVVVYRLDDAGFISSSLTLGIRGLIYQGLAKVKYFIGFDSGAL